MMPEAMGGDPATAVTAAQRERAAARVNLLLNQAASTSFEGERNVAIVKAQMLCARYGVAGPTLQRVERALQGDLVVEVAPQPRPTATRHAGAADFAGVFREDGTLDEERWDTLVGYRCSRCGGEFSRRHMHFSRGGMFCVVCWNLRSRQTPGERRREDMERQRRDTADWVAQQEAKGPRLEAWMRAHGMADEAARHERERLAAKAAFARRMKQHAARERRTAGDAANPFYQVVDTGNVQLRWAVAEIATGTVWGSYADRDAAAWSCKRLNERSARERRQRTKYQQKGQA